MEPTVHQANQRLPRYRRAANFPNIRIGRPEHLILQALGRLHYLSAPQVTRLLFSPTSLSYVQEHLKALFHAGFVQRLFLPTPTPYGSSPAIYTLDRKGFDYFKASTSEGTSTGRFRASEQAKREWLFLEHTLAINDFLIAAEQLAKARADIDIAKMLHERELKRRPIYVKHGDEQIGVVPDCWLDLRQGNVQRCLAVEIDRSGRVERQPFQRKVRGYVEYSKGTYQQAFGTPSLTVAVVVLQDERRLNEVIDWTAKQLQDMDSMDQADLFRFAALQPALADPHDVFLSPAWLRPFDQSPRPLLDPLPLERTAC